MGLATTSTGHKVKYGLTKGSSDLIGWTKNGRFLAVEVKTERGTVSKEQRAFIDTVNSFYGIGMIARSVDDFVTQMKRMESTWQLTMKE